MESETIIMLTKLWPMFVAFILLIVTLAQSHYRIKVLEDSSVKLNVNYYTERINIWGEVAGKGEIRINYTYP